MIRFLTNRNIAREGPAQPSALGVLEMEVMEVLWARGESNVRDVGQRLERKLAYTTVMTTLDRLFKKGLLDRRKSGRAFVYAARLSHGDWERQRAEGLVAGFLAGPQPARELLISCLLDAVGQHDEVLLDELEKKVRMRRKELFRRGQP
jgi:predicted transcriptional regulator